MDIKNVVRYLHQIDADELKEMVVNQLGLTAEEVVVRQKSGFNHAEFRLEISPVRSPYYDNVGYLPKTQLTIGYDTWADERSYIYLQPDVNSYTSELDNLTSKIREFREATTTKGALTAVLKYVKNTYRKPVSSGCVQAFVGFSLLLWVSKRPTSDKICEFKERYFLASDMTSSFIKVYTARDERKWLFAYDNTLRRDFVQCNGSWYHKSLIVPIYTRFNQETRRGEAISRYELAWSVSDRWRSYDGEPDENGFIPRVYTIEPLPYSQLWSRAIHGYSTRIEQMVEAEDLFKKGKVDLYSRRPQEETPFLGWELEACYGSMNSEEVPTTFKKLLEKQVICKADGSITPAGFETVSIPATLDFWKESLLKDTLNTMRSDPYGMRSYNHSSCGFHVHVSRSALSVLDLQKLERFMHNPENKLFLNAIAGRGPNNYQNYDHELMFHNRNKFVASNGRNRPPYRQRDYIAEEYQEEGRLTAFYGTPSANAHTRLCRIICYAYGFSSLMNFSEYNRIIETLKECLVPTANEVIQGYVPSPRTSSGTRSVYQNAQNISRQLEGAYTGGAQPFTPEEFADWCYQISTDTVRHNDSTRNMMRAMLEVTYGNKYSWNAPDNNAWKVAPRKTTLPIGRIYSYAASQAAPGPVGKGAVGRYDVLNTRNEKTIEFRLFKGTMNPDSVFRYLEFVDAMVRFVPSTSATNAGLHYEMFLRWLAKDSFNVLRYEHLVAFLVKGNYIDRANIRRRDLSSPVENDDDVSSIEKKVSPPTPVIDPNVSIETLGNPWTEATASVDLSTISFTEPPEEDFYDQSEDECDCADCRFSRDEISSAEYFNETGRWPYGFGPPAEQNNDLI